MAKHHMSLLASLAVSLCYAGLALAQPTAAPTPDPILEPLPAKGFQAQWRSKVNLHGGKLKALYLSETLVFLYTADNSVVAVSRATGAYVFGTQVTKQADVLYPPVVLKDWVVFPTTTSLQVYDKRGKMLRELPTRFALRTGAVGEGTRVYLAGDFERAAHIVAIDASPSPYPVVNDWDKMGTRSTGFINMPAYFQGLLFTASRNGYVYALRADDGEAMWPALRDTDFGFKTDDDILADVKVDGTGVFVACTDSKLYCLDVNSGKQKWAYHAGVRLEGKSSPSLAPDMVYMWVPKKGMVAIDNKPGSEVPIRTAKWAMPDGVQFLAQDANTAYIAATDHAIVAVDRANGNTKYVSRRNNFSCFASNSKDATIYAASTTGEVMAIKPITKPGSLGEEVRADQPAEAVAAK